MCVGGIFFFSKFLVGPGGLTTHFRGPEMTESGGGWDYYRGQESAGVGTWKNFLLRNPPYSKIRAILVF